MANRKRSSRRSRSPKKKAPSPPAPKPLHKNTTTTINHLPPELLIEIGLFLPSYHALQLCLCSRKFSIAVGWALYRRDALPGPRKSHDVGGQAVLWGATRGILETIRKSVAVGGDPNRPVFWAKFDIPVFRTPLQIATQNNYPAVVSYLLQVCKASRDVLIGNNSKILLYAYCPNIMRSLLEDGFHRLVNLRARQWRTGSARARKVLPLLHHLSQSTPDIDIIRLMLEYGASPFASDRRLDYGCAWHLAKRRHQRQDLMDLLIEFGFDERSPEYTG